MAVSTLRSNEYLNCISCGNSDCGFWFEGRRNLNMNGSFFSVEGHINRSMAYYVVYVMGMRYIGVSIVVSPGFRSKKELSEFLTNYKNINKYDFFLLTYTTFIIVELNLN